MMNSIIYPKSSLINILVMLITINFISCNKKDVDFPFSDEDDKKLSLCVSLLDSLGFEGNLGFTEKGKVFFGYHNKEILLSPVFYQYLKSKRIEKGIRKGIIYSDRKYVYFIREGYFKGNLGMLYLRGQQIKLERPIIKIYKKWNSKYLNGTWYFVEADGRL